jgi:hypothetical protein
MFNETSYPLCGLGDAAAVQRRLDAGKKVKLAKIEKFGLTVPDSYGTLPLPKASKPKGSVGGAGGGVLVDPLIPDSEGPDPNLAPATDDSGGGGFDLGGIFSALPWWAWALGAYFLLKKR